MRSVFATFLLFASAASAQTVALDYAFQESDKFTFNNNACADKVQVTWTATSTALYASELRLWATTGECGDSPVAGDFSFDSVAQTDLTLVRTSTFDVTFTDLPGLKGTADAGTVCGTEGVELTHRICGSVQINSGVGTLTYSRTSSLSLIYDALPPKVPVIEKVTEQDSALKVEVSATAETSVVHVDVRAFGQTEFAEKGQVIIASATSVTLQNLNNGTTYDIRARAEDAAGNFSVPTELASGTPRQTFGFFARYREAGGGERGCAVAGGVPLAIAVGLWILRRKRG